MVYIFLDESGDLGFKDASSKWFIFTIAIVQDKRVLEREVKKVWRTLRKKHSRLNELHASNEKDVTRSRLLSRLGALDQLKVQSIVLNKEKVYVDLKNQKNILYNYTANILLDRLHSKGVVPPGDHIELYIDRKDTKKSLRQNFLNYLASSMESRKVKNFKIELHTSHENKSLQAVDFISWAIFRKYEHGDFEFYDLIKSKIIDERLLFP
jgi:hypothetical protein